MSSSNVKADRVPFFYDVTLRDGNQALAKRNNEEKEKCICSC